MSRATVVVTDHDFTDLAIEREVLEGVAEVVAPADDVSVDPEDAASVLADADGVLNLRYSLDADLIAALLLSLVRGLKRYDASVAAGGWDRAAAAPLSRFSTLTVGVVGSTPEPPPRRHDATRGLVLRGGHRGTPPSGRGGGPDRPDWRPPRTRRQRRLTPERMDPRRASQDTSELDPATERCRSPYRPPGRAGVPRGDDAAVTGVPAPRWHR